MKMQWSKGLAAGAVAVALATAGAQTTVTSTSKSSSFTTTASSGGQSGTSSTVKDDLFAGTEVFAKGASDVTEVTMDPDSLGMVGGRDKAKAHSMVLNVVRTYEYDKPGMYNIADVDAFRNKLNTGEWHCSVHTRSLKSGESTDVCNRRRSDDMVETAIITVEPKELTFIHTIRKRGTGEGSWNFPGGESYMVMPGLGALPQLAMLDPEMIANTAMMKARMAIDMPALALQMHSTMKEFPKLDSTEMRRKIDEAMKAARDAEKQTHEDSSKKPE